MLNSRGFSLFSLGSENQRTFLDSKTSLTPPHAPIVGTDEYVEEIKYLNTFQLFAAHLCILRALFIFQSCLGSMFKNTLTVKPHVYSRAEKSHLAGFGDLPRRNVSEFPSQCGRPTPTSDILNKQFNFLTLLEGRKKARERIFTFRQRHIEDGGS